MIFALIYILKHSKSSLAQNYLIYLFLFIFEIRNEKSVHLHPMRYEETICNLLKTFSFMQVMLPICIAQRFLRNCQKLLNVYYYWDIMKYINSISITKNVVLCNIHLNGSFLVDYQGSQWMLVEI